MEPKASSPSKDKAKTLIKIQENHKCVRGKPMAKNVNKKGKKALKIVLLSIAAIILIALIYVAYVFISYSRIDDNVVLTPDIVGAPSNEVAVVGDEYTITTYNIGFGAYTSDYSFFMDGGTQS